MKKNKKEYKLVRLSIYSIDRVLSDAREKDFKGFKDYFEDGYKLKVKMRSQRYRVFDQAYRNTGKIACMHCGIEATHFALEQHGHQNKFDSHNPVSFHFNLYGLDENNNEVLFTKDHIIPLSKGGINYTDNMQVLCTHCNLKKGNKII